ncbi:MAG: hypothetical protein HUU54_04695 [Ignavibacteriaceae bacterium]|nr:hypothetical protein [Ignavibacteriaceae bacterium]
MNERELEIDELSERFNQSHQIDISVLPKGAKIVLLTGNSTYWLEMVYPPKGKVKASGGIFKDAGKDGIITYVLGSRLNDKDTISLQLIVGMNCVFENNIITSPIQKLFIEPMKLK